VLADQLRREFGLVSYAPPEVVLRPLKPLSDPQYAAKLNLAVREVMGEGWRAAFSDAPSQPSITEQEAAAEAALRSAILATPVVAATMAAFPDAELIGYEGDPRKVTA
jgi:DNA polymerase III subunit gamma/tau